MKAVFDTKPTSIYDDDISKYYQFPRSGLLRLNYARETSALPAPIDTRGLPQSLMNPLASLGAFPLHPHRTMEDCYGGSSATWPSPRDRPTQSRKAW